MCDTVAMYRIDAISDLRQTLRNIRKDKALSQSDLAQTAGVSRKWIVELENGSRSVRLDTLLLLLNALDVRLAIEPNSPRSIDLDELLDETLDS